MVVFDADIEVFHVLGSDGRGFGQVVQHGPWGPLGFAGAVASPPRLSAEYVLYRRADYESDCIVLSCWMRCRSAGMRVRAVGLVALAVTGRSAPVRRASVPCGATQGVLNLESFNSL